MKKARFGGALLMELAMEKRELFESCAGFVLAKLDEALPDKVHLIPSKLLAEMGEEASEENVRR